MNIIFEDNDLEELVTTGRNSKYKKYAMATRNNPSAFLATHPGEVLAAELEERGIIQKAFAEEIGMRPSHLSELINGKRNVTMAIADKLQEALGIEAQSWMNLQVLFV